MIALIAHDRKKSELKDFVVKNKSFFQKTKLVATEATAKCLQEEGFEVEAVPHGPMGGDIVIGSMICRNQISSVFFFRDLMCSQPHEPDVTALLRMCDIYNIPLATNIATAACLVKSCEGDVCSLL